MHRASSLYLVPPDPPRAPARESDALPLFALTLAWIAVVLAVDPRGGFPLNDDWAYGRVALDLADHGRLAPSFWQSMPLVTNALWGAAFARLFGSSWFALRLSSLVAGWLAVVGAYLLLREVGWRRARATAGAATLLANPWLVALSSTFMTDVPFLTTVTWSAWAWLRAIGRGDRRWLALAAALGIAATLSRQLGLALPIAFAIPLLRRRAFGPASWTAALVPLAATILALVAYDHSRHAAGVSAAVYDVKSDALVRGAIGLLHLHGWPRMGGRLVIAFTYLGLFALPVAIGGGTDRRAAPGQGNGLAAYTLGALAGIAILAAGWSMPLGTNIVIDLGIGPRTIAGSVPGAPAWLWRVLTIVAGVGAALLVRALVARARAAWRGDDLDGRRWKPIAAALAAATLFAPSAVADTGFFDRHLLVLLPLLLATLPGDPRRPAGTPSPLTTARDAATAAIAAVLALFSVAATHDYLAWQRVRSAAVDTVTASGAIAPADLDAGFELDNLVATATATATATALADRSSAPFVVSATPLAGHRPVLRVAVPAWMPLAVRDIFVLERPGRPGPLR